MSLKQDIEIAIKTAMLAKSKDELRALRSIKSLILLAETEKGNQGGISDEVEMTLLVKAAKQRRDSAGIYKEQGREDLEKIELAELDIINRYLPEQMSEADVRKELTNIIGSIGATGPQDMGKVMGGAMKSLGGKADGKLISTLVKELLAN